MSKRRFFSYADEVVYMFDPDYEVVQSCDLLINETDVENSPEYRAEYVQERHSDLEVLETRCREITEAQAAALVDEFNKNWKAAADRLGVA